MTFFRGNDLTCVRGERTVFSGLDFAVKVGGALVLTGPNGSGKSSLLRLLAGLLPPWVGTLHWDGALITDDTDGHRERLNYVGHLDPVKPVLSVAENLSFWAAIRGAPGDHHDQAVMAALKTLGIGHLAATPGRFLSAGQKRRVNLARLLVSPAPLWLLDEPTTALDTNAITALERAISDHRRDGGIVVISTHTDINLGEDKVITLDLARFAPKVAA